MTQMMSRPYSPELTVDPCNEQLERRNRKLAAAAFTFLDPVHVEVYKTTTRERPGLHHNWKYIATLPGVVVGVHGSVPHEYPGLVPVLTDDTYPTVGPYVDQGPRLLDPLTPQIEQLPQGAGWQMYDLRHDQPAVIL